MKHRSIQHTVTPSSYTAQTDPKKVTVGFNKWAKYIHREVARINKA